MTGFLHPAETNGGTVLRDGPWGGEEGAAASDGRIAEKLLTAGLTDVTIGRDCQGEGGGHTRGHRRVTAIR